MQNNNPNIKTDQSCIKFNIKLSMEAPAELCCDGGAQKLLNFSWKIDYMRILE